MRGRIFLVIFLILLASGGIFYYFKSFKPALNKTKESASPTIVQLMPFPTVVSGEDGKRDASLYELLINKSKKIISISNGRLDFSEFFAKKNIYFDNLFLHFFYDDKTSKVKFNGHISADNNPIDIDGEYNLDDKNNILLQMKFHSNIYDLTVNSVYTPHSNNIDEGSVKGQFTLDSNDLFKTSDEFRHLANILGVQFVSNEKAHITGEFTYNDQVFTLKNAELKSTNADLNLTLDSKSGEKYDLISKLHINKMNLDEMIIEKDRKGLGKFVTLASLIIDEYGKEYDIGGTIVADDVILNKKHLTNLSMSLTCDPNKNVTVKDFTVTIEKNNKLTSSGTLTHNQYRPIYQGDLQFNSSDTKVLLEILGVKNPQAIFADHKATFDSKIMMTPILVNLTDIKLHDQTLDAEGDLRLSYYGNKFKAVKANLSINNFDANQETIIHKLVNKYDLLAKSNDKSFTESILSFRKFNSIYDLSLNLNDFKYNDQVIQQAGADVVLRADALKIQNISVKSPISNFSGKFSVDVNQKKKPYMSLMLSGDKVDGDILLGILLHGTSVNKQLLPKHDESLPNDSSQNTAYNLPNYPIHLFRFDKFDGYLNLKFNEVNFGKQKFNDFYFDSVMKDNLINVRKFNLNMFDGYLQSVGNVTLSPFAFNVAYSYTGAKLKDIAKSLFNSNRFAGKLNMTGNIYGKGNDLHEIINTMGGSFTFKTNKLLAKNFNANALLNTYGTYIPKDFDNNISKGETIFKSFSGQSKLENGKLKIKDAEFSTNKTDGKVNSEINLLNGAQTTVTSFAFVGENNQVDGFNISFVGPINNPKVKLGTESANN